MAYTPNSSTHAVDIEVTRVLLQLGEDELDVTDISDSLEDLDLLKLHVNWVSVLDEEDLDILVEDRGALVQDELYVSERYVLDLVRGSQQRDQRVRQPGCRCPHELNIPRAVHEFEHYLHRSQHHCWVHVGQTRVHSLNNVFCFL